MHTYRSRTDLKYLIFALWSAVTLCWLLSCAFTPPEAKSQSLDTATPVVSEGKPNVILILADDLGYGQLGIQGGRQIPTPNIDSISLNGVRFTSGYVSCPVCSPTRAGLLTGRYQQRFGHEFNPGGSGADIGLPTSEITIANRMKTLGYTTGMIGKWHLGNKSPSLPNERGFDEFFGFLAGAHQYFGSSPSSKNPILRNTKIVDEKQYLTTAFNREAVSFIERHSDEPFFLYLSYNAVHAPLQAPKEYLSQFGDIKNKKRRTFAAMLASMDDGVGQVLDKLREHDLEEKTLVFFLSDNGGPTKSTTSRNDPLRGFKGQVLEGGIRIPFMVQWKGHLPAGKVYDKPIISLDIYPTAIVAAGSEIQDGWNLDGVNLLPFLRGENSGEPHDTLYWRYGDQWAIRSGKWKLFKNNSTATPQLINLDKDIHEDRNIAVKNPAVVKEMLNLYEQWSGQMQNPRWEKIPNKAKPKKASSKKAKDK